MIQLYLRSLFPLSLYAHVRLGVQQEKLKPTQTAHDVAVLLEVIMSQAHESRSTRLQVAQGSERNA